VVRKLIVRSEESRARMVEKAVSEAVTMVYIDSECGVDYRGYFK
jgi:hypothetical protein